MTILPNRPRWRFAKMSFLVHALNVGANMATAPAHVSDRAEHKQKAAAAAEATCVGFWRGADKEWKPGSSVETSSVWSRVHIQDTGGWTKKKEEKS